MLRFIHTADVHIGRSFRGFDNGLSARLHAARVGAIERVGEMAHKSGVGHVVVAGDLFDSVVVPAEDRRQAAAAMAEFAGVQWWILPGNHDPSAALVWDAWREAAPQNTRLLDAPVPVEMESGVWILPAPITGARHPGDPTRVLDGMATPEGALRIALAHGSVASFGSSVDPDAIDLGRLGRLGVSYVALGDWHGQKEVAPGVFYAGTPEADGFGAQGRALLVDVGHNGSKAQSIDTGAFVWSSTETLLPPGTVAADGQRLVQEARPSGRARTTLWRWRPVGPATPASRAALEMAFAGMAPDFLQAQVDWSGVSPVYDAADAADLAPEGALRAAVVDLMTTAEQSPNPYADRALSLLAAALKETA